MRIHLTLDVPDGARRYIATVADGDKPTARGKMARRDTVRRYVQDRINLLSGLHPYWDDQPLSAHESDEAAAAVDYLRKQGQSDAQIRAWLLTQRARYRFLKKRGGELR